MQVLTPQGPAIIRDIPDQTQGIYLILDLTNRKTYVGSSVDLRDRMFVHRSSLRGNRHYNQHLQRSCNAGHELKAFIIPVVEGEDVRQLEQQLIDEFMPRGVLFNRDRFATRPATERYPTPEEVKEKLREANKVAWSDPDLLVRHSEAAKRRMSAPGKIEQLQAARTAWQARPENKDHFKHCNDARWSDSDARQAQREALAKQLEDPEQRARLRREVPVQIDGQTYPNIKTAKQALNVAHGTILCRLQSDGFPTWVRCESRQDVLSVSQS